MKASLNIENIYLKLKNESFGYLTLFLIALIIIQTKLLNFFIFFLFVHLCTEFFSNTIHSYFPSISKKFLILAFYLLLVGFFLVGSLRFVPEFINDFPSYTSQIETQIKTFIVSSATKYKLDFDYSILKEKIFDEGAKALKDFLIIFKGISKGFFYFVFSLLLNYLLFSEKRNLWETFAANPNSLMAYLYNFIYKRMSVFYWYFKKVIGGQAIISLINTLLTLIVVFSLDLPHKISLIFLVFIFGLIPAIGNVISNSILAITAFFSQGMFACVICLFFLVGVHKLEYLLNSQIIGSIVRLPMFVILMSILLCEALMGLMGVVIAIPLVLFLKKELESLEIVSAPVLANNSGE